MARKKRNEILVGGFIAVSLGLFILLFFLKGTLAEALRPAAHLQVVFDDVRGLKAGDPVFFLGSKVGQVAGLEFSRRPWPQDFPELFPKDSAGVGVARVIVHLSIDGRIRSFIRLDTPVEIAKNLTGNLSVLILEGRGEPLPVEQSFLRGNPGTELTSVVSRATELIAKSEPVVENLEVFSRRLRNMDSIEVAVKDAAQILQQLREAIGPLQSGLRYAIDDVRSILSENRGDLRAVTANLAAGTEHAARILEKVDPAIADLRGAIAQLERAAAGVADTLAENRPGIDAVVDAARNALANAANITADIRRRPWRLLHRPSKEETAELDLYDAAWAYNLGAADLERSLRFLATRLEAAPAGSASAEALLAARREVEASLRRHHEAEDAFWERLKAR